MMAPRNHTVLELKGPADKTSPMPPGVAQDVQELITEVERAKSRFAPNAKILMALWRSRTKDAQSSRRLRKSPCSTRM